MPAKPIMRPANPAGASKRGWLGTVLAVLTTFVVVAGLGVAMGFALEAFSTRIGATPFDARVTRWFVSHRSDGLTTVMRTITTLGGTIVVVALTATVIAALALKGQIRPAVFLAVAAIGASILSALVKAIVNRDRPPQSFHLVHVASSAFPSGHATQAAATYLALGIVATVCLNRRYARATWMIVAVVIAAVGASRLYLGVHWATDVLGGWLLGAAWTTGLVLSFRPLSSDAIAHSPDSDAERLRPEAKS